MNTVSDLEEEFASLAARAPGDDAIRAALADGIAVRERRRRTTALVAIVAAVLLVAGGIGLTRALIGGGPARPAGPSPQPVVTVPDVPLPADTQLIRHRLQPVTSPVTVTPPAGLTGQVWYRMPGRLTVSWFDPSGKAFGWTVYTPLSDASAPAAPRSAGYAVTDAKDDPITGVTANGAGPVTAEGRQVSIGGHAALLITAPRGAVDGLGFPASERLTWQLADGRWIHVWAIDSGDGPAEGSGPSAALAAFAATIAEKPSTLDRALGIGLTLPHLTHDWSLNYSTAASYLGPTLFLCPAGVDPYGGASATASGSASAPAAGGSGGSDYGSTVSIEPGVGPGTVTSDGGNPAGACLTVAVVNGVDPATQMHTTPVRVGDTVAKVDVEKQAAAADLGDGVTAVVGGRTVAGPRLSADDLAALVASVRLSPAVTVIPFTAGAGGEASSASGPAMSAAEMSGTAAALDPAIAQPFVIPAGGDALNVDNAGRTVTVDVPLQNVTDVPVTVTRLSLAADGLTRTAIKVRAANGPGDADAPFTDVVLPTVVAPRLTVRLRFTFEVAAGACSAVSDRNPPLVIGYRVEASSPDGSSASAAGGELDLVMPDFGGRGWIAVVTDALCR